jgi:hypothetical protein
MISVSIPLCSFVPFVVKILGLSDHARCRAITAISAILAALCLRPSAGDPTPHKRLLKTKAKPQFDRAVTERSKLIFCVFRWSNQAQFQPCFLVSSVRSAEGRQAPKAARRKDRRASNRHPERAA